MRAFQPYCLPTAVGSLPHSDPAAACDLVLRYLPEIPVWPQLPNRSSHENMYVQCFERFPGAAVQGDRVIVEGGGRFEAELENLYADYLEGDSAKYDLDPSFAAGLAEMGRRWGILTPAPVAVKGQVTGPISGGLQITNADGRPVLYDEVMSDALAKYVGLVAREHERTLAQFAERTIVMIDEPYLSAVGSAFIQIHPEQVRQLLGEVMSALSGLKGIHCCGNTDWSLVLSVPADVLSFDAYNYAETLALYAADVKSFLGRGGIIAWGIVPTDERSLASEDANSLLARLNRAFDLLASRNVDRDGILSSALITPSCGLGTLPPSVAARALALTAEVAVLARRSCLAL